MAKSKRNPERKCELCGVKIHNRQKGSKYCKHHAEKLEKLKIQINNSIQKIRIKYPEFNISFRLSIKLSPYCMHCPKFKMFITRQGKFEYECGTSFSCKRRLNYFKRNIK